VYLGFMSLFPLTDFQNGTVRIVRISISIDAFAERYSPRIPSSSSVLSNALKYSVPFVR
jgi:hypothetical protein